MPNKPLQDILTFTRPDPGTYYDAQGVLRTAAIDEPRLTYDPETLESEGLLSEKQSANLLLNNDAPATQTVSVTNATIYTLSVYGSGSAEITLGGAGVASKGEDLTFTTTGTSVQVTVSGSLSYFQLEQGSVATSIILTSGTQDTRAADDCFRTLGPEYNADAFSCYAEFSTIEAVPVGNNPHYVEFSDGSNDNRVLLQRINGSNTIRLAGVKGGSVLFTLDYNASADVGSVIKVAASLSAASAIFAINGASMSDTVGESLPVLSIVNLGQKWDNSNHVEVCKYKKFNIEPRALSATKLEAMTAI